MQDSFIPEGIWSRANYFGQLQLLVCLFSTPCVFSSVHVLIQLIGLLCFVSLQSGVFWLAALSLKGVRWAVKLLNRHTMQRLQNSLQVLDAQHNKYTYALKCEQVSANAANTCVNISVQLTLLR